MKSQVSSGLLGTSSAVCLAEPSVMTKSLPHASECLRVDSNYSDSQLCRLIIEMNDSGFGSWKIPHPVHRF